MLISASQRCYVQYKTKKDDSNKYTETKKPFCPAVLLATIGKAKPPNRIAEAPIKYAYVKIPSGSLSFLPICDKI